MIICPEKSCHINHSYEDILRNNKVKRINDELGLKSKHFVHIPVKCHGLLHGQLSCSVDEGIENLDMDLTGGLSLLGMMLGDYKALYAQRNLEYTIKQFDDQEERLVLARDSRATLRLINKLLRELLSAEYATTFDFNWYDGKLTAVCEIDSNGNESELAKADDYFDEKQYLTGMAYYDERYRFVCNLTDFATRHPELIKKSSLKKYLGDRMGGSVAYDLIGYREHKSLIRVFNKKNSPNIPFDFFERDILKKACAYFSRAYDDIISYSQLDRIQQLSVSITNQ